MNLARDQKQKSVQEKLTGYQIYLSKCMKQNSNMLEWSKHADNSIKKHCNVLSVITSMLTKNNYYKNQGYSKTTVEIHEGIAT